MTELDVAAAIKDVHRREGHAGIYFMRHPDYFMARGLFASGPNLMRLSGPAFSLSGAGLDATVPAGPSLRVIRPADFVLIDIPVLIGGTMWTWPGPIRRVPPTSAGGTGTKN
jgi:Xaa-Pro dipeptidase